MKNITVFIEGGKGTLNLTRPIATYASTLTVKEATVFWNFKNITSDIDNTEVIFKKTPEKVVTLEEGYWDFQQIKERLDGEKLKLSANTHNNTCSINNKSDSTVNLKKFGTLLLGFPENQNLPTGTTITSPKPVDVNHGLRYLTVTCDLIDSSKNIGTDGNSSTIITYLPVTPGTRLNSNCHVYDGDCSPRSVENDIVSKIDFKVESDLKGSVKVDVDVLLTLTLD